MDVLVDAEQVSKKFCRSLRRSLWYGVRDIASAFLVGPTRSLSVQSTPMHSLPALREEEFWALRDISFQVKRGECLGLVGHNGAGKSTLLKLLNGLIRPDAGRVSMRGRVGALIELNAAFNPLLTGRENIYNEATLLGFTKSDINSRFDQIVDFAEIHEFLDMPVQNYSSGMRVRLGFAIAAELEPDVLLIDEVLAVGDVGFRAKCLARMGELRKKCAFIFVSHSMPQVARISTSVLHLDHGRPLLLTSDLTKGLASYYSTFASGDAVSSGSGEVQITSVGVRLNDSSPFEPDSIAVAYGESIEFEIKCEFRKSRDAATMQLVIWNQELIPVVDVLGPGLRRFAIHPDDEGQCVTRVIMNGLTLNSGRFTASIVVLSPDGLTTLCQIDRAIDLEVTSNLGSACTISLCGEWTSMTPVRTPTRAEALSN